MAIPRNALIDLESTPYYHLTTRCNHGRFSLGFDELTEQDHTMRRHWILDNLKLLTSVFSIECCAYAIMSNHYHLVVKIDAEKPRNWSDDEIIHRWSKIYPHSAKKEKHIPERVQDWRESLSDISVFMKYMNQNIARSANKEDKHKGHFWEERFHSQAILDFKALLATMIYVDLNPIRAGQAKTPEDSEFTSIQERLELICSNKQKPANLTDRKDIRKFKSIAQPTTLIPFMNPITVESLAARTNCIEFTLFDYIELLEFTGRKRRTDKHSGKIPKSIPHVFERLGYDAEDWLAFVGNAESGFSTAIGSSDKLITFAKKTNRKGLPKSIKLAKRMYASARAA